MQPHDSPRGAPHAPPPFPFASPYAAPSYAPDRLTPAILDGIVQRAWERIFKHGIWKLGLLVAFFLVLVQLLRGGVSRVETLVHSSPEFIPIVVAGALFPLLVLWVAVNLSVIIAPRSSRPARLIAKLRAVRFERTDVKKWTLVNRQTGTHLYTDRVRIRATLSTGQRVELLVNGRTLREPDPTLERRLHDLMNELR